MIDHLKLSKTTAIEALDNCSANSDLKLIGIAPLKTSLPDLRTAIDHGDINDSCLFKNVFGYNVNFFYVIEQVENNIVVNYERGIGHIYEKNGETYLDRKVSFVNGKNSAENFVNTSGQPFSFRCCNYNLVLYSSLPPTYFESLSPANCVLTSSEPCLPNPVVLHNDSLLGRLDNGIESISLLDNRLVDKLINLISKFTKQLKLKTSKLSLKKVETETLDLIPTTNPKAKAGTLYYDNESNELKVFDGTSWRVLIFKENAN